MDLKKQFTTDHQIEREGVWVQMDTVARIKVARIDNADFRELSRRLGKPYRQAARAGVFSDETATDIMIQCLAKTILLDWEGLSEDGQPIPYSQKEAVRVLTAYKDFREFVVSASSDAELFRAAAADGDEKNSSTPSPGT